jgi:FkbM family methyltransferase
MEMLLRKARIAITPRSWLLKRTLSNGATVYGENKPGHGSRAIYLEGDHIEPELLHLEKLLDRDGVLIDIGANSGMFALKAAKHFSGNGLVIAVEPGFDMLRMLSYSVSANGFKNVRLRAFCIGERTEEQTLWLNHNKPNAFSLMKRSESAYGISVLVVSLDDLCQWERLTRLDYVKVDVVGSEEKVLAGAAKTMSQFRPIFQISLGAADVPMSLPGYSIYRMPHGAKANKVYIADDDHRANRFLELGWRKADW